MRMFQVCRSVTNKWFTEQISSINKPPSPPPHPLTTKKKRDFSMITDCVLNKGEFNVTNECIMNKTCGHSV